MDSTCVVFLSLRSKWSFKSDLFVFNASLNDVAPMFPMLLSVDFVRIEKSELFVDAICVLFLCLHNSDRVL